jgi:hypothetical protein
MLSAGEMVCGFVALCGLIYAIAWMLAYEMAVRWESHKRTARRSRAKGDRLRPVATNGLRKIV